MRSQVADQADHVVGHQPPDGPGRVDADRGLAGRGINRRSGTLIIAAYLVFAITVIVKALPPGA